MADHSTNGAAPLPAAGDSRRAVFVISLICAAQFVLQLDFSVVNVALPSIQRELGMPAAELLSSVAEVTTTKRRGLNLRLSS
jgi:hypothetical protein